MLISPDTLTTRKDHTMQTRPNVLILMSDEHRADVTGFAGNDVIRTPTLDWLAEGGCVFENAYTPSPICVPARQCIFAGQYPKTCGCEGWKGLAPGHMTYAHRFAQYGYQTAGFGKMHLIGPDQLAGWQTRPIGDIAHGAVMNPIESFFDGFQAPQDDNLNCPNSMKWSDEKEVRRAGICDRPRHDDHYADVAVDWVGTRFVDPWYDRAIRNRPLLMYFGTHNPHYPYICREELFRYYLPRVKDFEVETCFDHPFLGTTAWPYVPLQTGRDLPRREVQRARAAYYGKVEAMDGHCGQILDALRFAGEDLDDWIIVYCSDHGDQLGEHGVWEKQKFFEGSDRVPFVIRAPKYLPQGVRIPQNVSLCDLFATLCEIAGLETPEGLDSRSLVPLAHGNADGWEDEACSFFLQQGYRNVMIKRGTLKYQWLEQDKRGVMPEVLFDLDADPHETENRIDDPAYADAVATFRTRLRELGYGA